METRKLKTVYPCCKGTCRLVAIDCLPREVYERKCSKCQTKWVINRTATKPAPGIIFDRLDWER